MSGDVRRQIAEALYRRYRLAGPPMADEELADYLLPVVERIARQKAADELRKAADEDTVTLTAWFGTHATHVTAVKTGELRARADALTAEA